MTAKIQFWIDGYANSGYKIKAAQLVYRLSQFQKQYPNRNYQLVRRDGKWFIAEEEK